MLAIDRTTEATIPATYGKDGKLTHNERRVKHTPNATGSGPHSGTVTVTEHTGVRVRRVVVDTYLVDEQPEIGVTGRVFLVLKDAMNGSTLDTAKGQKDAERIGNVYECRVYGEFGSCTCDGFVCSNGRNKCVHLLALSALVDAGLPHPQEGPPAEDWHPAEDDTAEIEVEPYRDDADAEPAPEPEARDWRIGPPTASGRPSYVIPPDQDMF